MSHLSPASSIMHVMFCRDQLRRTQSTLEDSGGSKSADLIGNADEEFTFEYLLKKNGISVSAVACSALKGDLGEVTSFIGRIARM